MALSSEVAAQLTEQFTQKQVSKKYVALVRGYTDDNGTIDYPLQEQLDKIADKNTKPDKPAQDAVTHYETLWKGEVPIPVGRYSSARYSLVSLTPETGRKHQIRRHMKHIFHPIIGDTTHGDGKHNNMFREQFALSRLLLVAKEIRFNHPESGESITISAPLGEEFERILTGLNCSIRLS